MSRPNLQAVTRPRLPAPLAARIAPGRLSPLAARLRCSEGELQSTIAVTVLAILVALLALPGVHAAPIAASPPAVPGAAPGPAAPATESPRPATPTFGTDNHEPPATSSVSPNPRVLPSPSGEPGEPPGPPAPCAAAANVQTLREALAPLAEVSGGVVPSDAAVEAVAAATGCSDQEVSNALTALVYAFGNELDELGIFPDIDVLPPLPALPRGLTDPLRPLVGPVVTPVCENLPVVLLVLVTTGRNFPPTIVSSDLLNIVLYAAIACSSLSTPGG